MDTECAARRTATLQRTLSPATSAALDLFIQGAAGGNEIVWCGPHCGGAILTPVCSLRPWGRRRQTDDRYRFVARYVSQDTLRVRRLSSFVLRMASAEAQNRKLGPCVAVGHTRQLCFPLGNLRAVPLASVGDQCVERTRDIASGTFHF